MQELLIIERLISEGKVSQEYIDAKVAELKATQPRIIKDVLSLEKRQTETERAIITLIDMTLMGGM